MVPRENHRLVRLDDDPVLPDLLLVDVDEPLKDLHPAVLRPDLLPEIGSSVPGFVWGIPRTVVVSLVEREEVRVVAGEFRRVLYDVRVDGEMDQSPAFEFEERFRRIAIRLVLLLRIFDVLPRHGVLQLRRRDGDSVDAESEVDALVRVRVGVVELPSNSENVRFVLFPNFGIETGRRLEGGEVNGHPRRPKAMPDEFEGPLAFESAL